VKSCESVICISPSVIDIRGLHYPGIHLQS